MELSVTRFGLLREKAWYRDRRQAERDVMQVFCAMHSIAKHQRRLAAHGAPGAPSTGASWPTAATRPSCVEQLAGTLDNQLEAPSG